MSNIANYEEEEILTDRLINQTVYVGLVDNNATGDDLEDGDLTNEIEDYDGDRKEINFTSPTQVDGKATINNDTTIDFENMPDTTVEYAIITDDQNDGNILWWSPAVESKDTNSGDTYRIPEGSLEVTLD